MKADLHFHSKYSDGAYWPNQLVRIAKNNGLEMIALTDHDTFEGVNEFMESAAENRIIGIPAIEIDFEDTLFGFKSELLGYFPEGNYTNTAKYIADFQKARKTIVERSLEKARRIYNSPTLKISELYESKLGGKFPVSTCERVSLTKVDVYNYLIYKKIPLKYSNYNHFKQEFFTDVEFIELSVKPDFKKCIDHINSDGGYAVLAHPAYQFNKSANLIIQNESSIRERLISARQSGLWGIEMHAYENRKEAKTLNTIFSKIAIECDLRMTYGSDFHSENSCNSRKLGCLKEKFSGFYK